MSEQVTLSAMRCLDTLAVVSADAVGWAAYDWLQINEAGLPYLPIVEGAARDDARFWSETATPIELECYALAACDRLNGLGGGSALFASRQIKRLAGGLFKRMSTGEKLAFATWIKTQIESDNA